MPMDEGKKLRSHETWSLNGLPLTETRLDSAATTKNPISNLFSPRKEEDALRALPRYFFLCVWVLSKWRCSAAYHYRPLFNGCEKCAYMGILKPHSRLLRSFIFFFFWSYSSMPFPIFFDPKCGRNKSSKKTCVSRTPRKKGTANTLLDKDFNFWSIFWRND